MLDGLPPKSTLARDKHMLRLPITLSILAVLATGCGRDLPEAPEPTTQPAAIPEAVTSIEAPIPPEHLATRIESIAPARYNPASDELLLSVRVHNDGQATLVSAGAAMVNLGAMLVGPEGPDVAPGLRDFVRAPLPVIVPADSAEIAVRLPAEQLLGLPVRLELVQEGVSWFSAYGQPSLDIGPFVRCNGQTATLCQPDGSPVAAE